MYQYLYYVRLIIYCQQSNILDNMTNKIDRISKKIGLKIKLLRNKIGISQEELGFRAGVSKQQIGLIERGESSPTIDTLDQIAHALEISLIDLVDISKIDL